LDSFLPSQLAANLGADGADRHLIQVNGSQVVARCSLWWNGTPKLNDRSVGFVGHYFTSVPWSGVSILEAAIAELQNHGCEMAIGPVDGSTWRNYRFITGKAKSPRFFLEQDHPLEWPYFFSKVGFYVCASYVSASAYNLSQRDAKAQE